MPDEQTLVDEEIAADFEARSLTTKGQFRLPEDLLNEHDLRGAVVDIQVTQGESAAAIMDAQVSTDGRVTVPAKKRNLYGFEVGEKVSGTVDKVVMR